MLVRVAAWLKKKQGSEHELVGREKMGKIIIKVIKGNQKNIIYMILDKLIVRNTPKKCKIANKSIWASEIVI